MPCIVGTMFLQWTVYIDGIVFTSRRRLRHPVKQSVRQSGAPLRTSGQGMGPCAPLEAPGQASPQTQGWDRP